MGENVLYNWNEMKARAVFDQTVAINKRYGENAGSGCTGGIKGTNELVVDAVVSL